MKVHLCDRCATIIYDVKDVHEILVRSKNSKEYEDYFRVIEVCTDCANRIVENFEDFINVCD